MLIHSSVWGENLGYCFMQVQCYQIVRSCKTMGKVVDALSEGRVELILWFGSPSFSKLVRARYKHNTKSIFNTDLIVIERAID